MANIQKQIEQFDESIRLKKFDENETLREKRDAVVNRIRDGFAKMREDGIAVPTFKTFNQGSYAMGTGINPAEGDYDIDVGLVFETSASEWPNPVDLKERVYDAIKDHTKRGAKIRRPCVTVYYQIDGEQAYHVDLAVYAQAGVESATETLFLSRGNLGSDEENRWWDPSDPKGLIKWIANKFSDEEAEQFLRVVRLLKRWKTERFDLSGNGAPTGIALTIATANWLIPNPTTNALTEVTTYDDVRAMIGLVSAMIARMDAKTFSVSLPVAPYNNLLEKMSDVQTVSFRDELVALKDVLSRVISEADPVMACETMREAFGDEFPVPEKEKTAQPRGRAISSSGVSA